MNAKRKTSQQGMTLVEVLVASFILAMTLGGSLATFSNSIRTIHTSRNVNEALQTGRQAMESLYDTDWGDERLAPGHHGFEFQGRTVGHYEVVLADPKRKRIDFNVHYHNASTGNRDAELAFTGWITKAVHE